MALKQVVILLTLFYFFYPTVSYSSSISLDDTHQIHEIQSNSNISLADEEIPSWGKYSNLKGSIEKVQAATIVMGSSTGVMISDSFAITAAHVPLDGETLPDYIWARNVHGQTVTVTNVWYDLDHDFAVVKLKHPFDISCALPLASVNAMAHDTVFLVGHPNNVSDAGLGWSVSFGAAFGLLDDDMSCFDINATNGFSGGPICNSKGEVLSVLSAIGSRDYWRNEPMQSPYFVEDAPVRNIELEQYMGYGSAIGAPLDFILGFLNKKGIVPKPGGNFSLPENKPDRASIPFVSEDDLAKIKLSSPFSRHSTVAFGRDKTPIWPTSRGSGVLITDDLVLTASHVVEKSWPTHAIGFTNGIRYDGCTVLATHPLYDLAIVRLPQPAPNGFEPVHIAEHQINWDEPGYTVGHPNGVWQPEGGWQVTTGRGFGSDKGDLVLNGSSQPGNSGGGIFNQWGNLAGILSWSSRSSEVRSPWDIQDPHSTDYWPTAQTDNGSYLGGTGFCGIKEFVSRYSVQGGKGYDYAYSADVLPNGNIATVGRTFNGINNDITLNFYDKVGLLTGSYSSIDKNKWEAGRDLTVLPDGKIIVIGNTHDQKLSSFLILCFNSDGSSNADFGQNGQVITSVGKIWDEAFSVKVQADGKILVAGTSYNGLDNDFCLVRYLPDGTLDKDFGTGGIFISGLMPTSDDYLMDMEIQKDQRIVLTGYSDLAEENKDIDWDFVTMRILPNGSLDASFGSKGWISDDIRNKSLHDMATCLAIQDDGKIVIGGFTDRGGNPDVVVIRYLPNGTRDPAFGNEGIAIISDAGQNFPDYPHSIVTRSNGKLILAGENWFGSYLENRFGSRSGNFNVAVWGLNSDGTIDESWGPKGLVSVGSEQDDYGSGLALLPNGIAIAGYSYKDGNSEAKLYMIDLNESQMDILLSKANIDENSTIGSEIGILSTTDPDAEESFSYSLVSGTGDTDNNSFTILGNKLLTNSVLDFEKKSSYSIRIQTQDKANNTFSKSFIININNLIETGINDLLSNDQIKVYPNPTFEFLNIETNIDKSAIAIVVSENGTIMVKRELSKNITQINLQGIARGVYLVLLKDKNKIIYQQKIVKK